MGVCMCVNVFIYVCMYVCILIIPASIISIPAHCALSNIYTSRIPVYAHILFTALCPTYTPAESQYMLTYCSLRSVQHIHQQYPSICSHTVHCALSNIYTSSIPVYAHIHVLFNRRIFLLSSRNGRN